MSHVTGIVDNNLLLPSGSQRKNLSPAWQFFKRTSKFFASCNLCSIQVPIKHGSTAGLFSHLKNKHATQYQTVRAESSVAAKMQIKEEDSKFVVFSRSIENIIHFLAGSRDSDNTFCDVTFHCKGGQTKAHKLVLASVSNFLKSIFIQSGEQEEIDIITDVEVEAFETFLNDLYTGKNFLQHKQIVNNLFILKPLKSLVSPPKASRQFDVEVASDNLEVKLEALADSDLEETNQNRTNDNLNLLQEDKFCSILSNPLLTSDIKRVKTTKKKRSQVWQHFSKPDLESSECRCHHCGKSILSHAGSTSAMMKHLVVTHPEVLDLREIPGKYKIKTSGKPEEREEPIKLADVSDIKDTAKCQVCDTELPSDELIELQKHLQTEHKEYWLKEGLKLKLLIKEKTLRIEQSFIIGEIENNMVCKLCQTVVTMSEMADHLKIEHTDYRPTLSIYYVIENGLAKCEICGMNNIDEEDFDCHLEANHPDRFEIAN